MAATSKSSCPEPRLIGLTSCHSDLGPPSSCPQAGKASSGWVGGTVRPQNTPDSQRHTGGCCSLQGAQKSQILPASDCHLLRSPCKWTPQPGPYPPHSPDRRMLPRPSPGQSLTSAQVQPKMPSLKGSSPTGTLLY